MTKKQKSPCGSCAAIRRRWVRVKRRGLLRTAVCVPPEAGLIKDDQMWGGMLAASSFKLLTVTSKCLRKNLTGELALVSYSRVCLIITQPFLLYQAWEPSAA